MTMAVISFNAVRKAVIATIKQSFPDMDVYGEEISQGFQEPCFFVKLFPASQKQIMDNRYQRYHAFDIHYFPIIDDENYVNDDMHDMAEQLYQILEYINVNGDQCRGTKMEYEIVDGVLHFFVHYNFFVYKEREKEYMEELILRQGVMAHDQ